MPARRRGAHRDASSARYRPFLVALVTLGVIGTGIVLFGRYGPPIAGWRSAGHTALVGPSPARSAPLPSSRTSTAPATGAPATSAAGSAAAPARVAVALNVPFPHSGPQTFRYATTTGPILGTSGPIRRFRIAIESNVDVASLADFAEKVDETLGDPRSWIAGGTYRLQRVPSSSSSAFTIYLATAKTTKRMCAPVHTNGFTSCRQGLHVVLNLDRYMTSVAGYRSANVPLDTYRTYMINHEVGHALGHGHELCPAAGAPAPVMQQQTLGLHGCVANPWPYLDGKRYDGPSGSY